MLRLQTRASQLRHAASLHLSEAPIGLKPQYGYKLPPGLRSCATFRSETPLPRDTDTIQKLLVANRGVYLAN